MPVDETSTMLESLRDDVIQRIETRAAERAASAQAACSDIQEALTEKLEERLRKHWPRKGRTEVISKSHLSLGGRVVVVGDVEYPRGAQFSKE